ncbi:hypothetical protein M2158_005699 [Streptomyces sp. SAI-144]|nr:hypothetical protein [Streptomyces sp. SAI-144]MDH6484583.1 hypothetical protein [Streptomyces sp. SAI-127]
MVHPLAKTGPMGRRGCRSGAWDGETDCQYDGEPVTGQGGAAGVSACGRQTGTALREQRPADHEGRPPVPDWTEAAGPGGVRPRPVVEPGRIAWNWELGYFRLGEARSGSVHPAAPDPSRRRAAGSAREDGLGAGPDLLPHPRLRTAGPVRHRPRPGAAAAPSPGSPASHGSSSTVRTRDATRPSPARAHTAAPPPQPHRRFGGRSRRAVPARHRPHGPRLAANRPFLLLLAWPPAAATGCASIRVGHRAPSAAQIWIRGPPAIGWLPVLRFGHGISAPIPFIRRFVSVVMQLGRRVIECSRRSSGT